MAKQIRTTSTSRQSADAQPIVLRDKKRVRLVFRPTLVENPHDASCSVNGTFVYQKRGKGEDWVDSTVHRLNDLKTGEGFQLKLHSKELYDLVEYINQLYTVYEHSGVPRGVQNFFVTADNASSVVRQILEGEHELEHLLGALGTMDDPKLFIKKLQTVNQADLAKIETLVNLSRLEFLVDDWKRRLGDSDEEYWQNELHASPWVIEQLFYTPIFLLQAKAYVGGKRLDNTGGSVLDFLYQKRLTRSVAVIEIKTPGTPLLGSRYRNGAYPPSGDLTGAISQALHYRELLMRRADEFERTAPYSLRIVAPQCIVIAGRIQDITDDDERLRSFERYRSELRSVELVTFDELIEKVQSLIDLMREDHTCG